MLLLLSLSLLLLLGNALSASTSGDFDTTSGSYEFIYHQQQELLLTIHHSACFHTHITGISCPTLLETQIMYQVRHHHGMSGSSLEHLRNQYQDLLANFHCLNKTVYELHLDSNFKCQSGGGDDDDDK